MNEAILNMLNRYECRTVNDYKNALKEVIQEVALLGLWRAKFFEHAAFYGGTCLRILHGLNRFSEDLDFSLLNPQEDFDLAYYLRAVEVELRSFGIEIEVHQKSKTKESAIQSAFLKANTLENLLKIGLSQKERLQTHVDEKLQVRFEIDTDPPPHFSTDVRYLLRPIPFSVKAFSLPCLFAGKLHAVLCRAWKNRVKGRDWYDLVWFVSREIPVDLTHLESRMRQTGHYPKDVPLSIDKLRKLMRAKIESLNVEAARDDVVVFLKDASPVEVWSRDFFLSLVDKIQVE